MNFKNLISMLNDKNDIILSQQAKIDELQARIAELEETICTHLDERFLKGNKDEN